MKKLHLLAFLFAGTALFLTSCEPEPAGPSVVLLPDAGFVSADSEVGANEVFSVRVSADQGDSEMNSFQVTADGAVLDRSNYTINGVEPASNTILLFDAERVGFTYDIAITAQADGTVVYGFEVTDVDGNRGSDAVAITVGTGTGGGDPNEPPTISVGGNDEVDLEANSLYSITVSATPAGEARLAFIAVYQDGNLIDASRCELGAYPFTENEFALPEEYQAGIDNEMLLIRVHDSGTSVYRVEIIDEYGNFNSFEKTVTTGPTGTPVDVITGALLNAAGPTGTGGLDLSTGEGTGSMDAAADIRDLGIDNGPVETNWLQQIAGVNGATVRYLRPGENNLAEGFTFAGVDSKETVEAIFDNGVDLTGGVSDAVQIGDMFTVRTGVGESFALLVTNVVVTAADNSDQYEFDIKF